MNIIQEHSNEAKHVIRKLESTSKKLINASSAVVFNRECLNNNLLPTFTNVRTHNEATRRKKFTIDFRRKLLENELAEKSDLVKTLSEQKSENKRQYDQLNITDDLRKRTTDALNDELEHHRHVSEARAQKKLCKLYGGWIPIPKPSAGFVNLTQKDFSKDQEEFLNLGINHRIASKYDPIQKKAELELLYQDVLSLRDHGKIQVNPDIKEQLMSESTKNRSRPGRRSLSPRLLSAAKELRNDKSIEIRKADKSNIYVILDKHDYLSKMDNILSDGSKFSEPIAQPHRRIKKEG